MIELVTSLRFGQGGNGSAWLRHGWSKPEEGFVWALGHKSTLTVPLLPTDGRVFLELAIQPFVSPPELPAQRLDVVVNGAVLAQKKLAWRGILRVEIPAALRQQPGLMVELCHPDASSPAQLGLAQDPRQLAIQIHGLTVLRSGARDGLPAPCGPVFEEAEYRFGGNETTDSMLVDGWGAPEIDYVWSVGRRSTFRLPIGPGEHARTLLLDVQPFIEAPVISRQRIAIGVDDHLLGFVSTNFRSAVAFALPPPRAGADFVTLSFDNMDAASPRAVGLYADGRPFAFMLCRVRVLRDRAPVHAVAATPMRQTALPGNLDDGTLQSAVLGATGRSAELIGASFESLGWTAELSLLQRRLGNEPCGLLRFANIATPMLVEGLFRGFWGLGRPDTMAVNIAADPGRSYAAVDDAYALVFQTSISSETTDEPAVKRQLARGLPFLVRKFFEDAVLGQKIFVFQRRDTTTRPEAEAVLAALSVWGDVTLLWVQQDNALAGGVERIGQRLLRGFVTNTVSDESWLRMMTNAWLECGP